MKINKKERTIEISRGNNIVSYFYDNYIQRLEYFAAWFLLKLLPLIIKLILVCIGVAVLYSNLYKPLKHIIAGN